MKVKGNGRKSYLVILMINENGQIEPEVTFLTIGIVIFYLSAIERNHSNVLFTLKEGSNYRLKLTFRVNNIFSGLTYSNAIWKGGIQASVDQSKGMLGTFDPQQEPYIHMLEKETTPSGVKARGTYMAKLKVCCSFFC
ncbi:Rho GDP-dissociation inhibitor 1 [Nymphaea thermarum]|nr:Rho GDP-dissociation inhibitor 1 [Nymphaea thermarum]